MLLILEQSGEEVNEILPPVLPGMCAVGGMIDVGIVLLVKLLAEYIAARADNPSKDVIVVASPYTKLYLSRYTKLKVKTLEELAAENI